MNRTEQANFPLDLSSRSASVCGFVAVRRVAPRPAGQRGSQSTMLRTITLLLAVLLVGSGLPTYFADAAPDELEQLSWVEKADPVADAIKAIARKDFTLLGVHGYTWTIPGVNEDDKFKYREKYGLRILDGTGDAVLNDEHKRLIDIATKYAKTYNQYLLSYHSGK